MTDEMSPCTTAHICNKSMHLFISWFSIFYYRYCSLHKTVKRVSKGLHCSHCSNAVLGLIGQLKLVMGCLPHYLSEMVQITIYELSVD